MIEPCLDNGFKICGVDSIIVNSSGSLSNMGDNSDTTIQFTWGIDTTSSKVISISAGILSACLSDNVQALAVMSCEAFGANLSMSPEICMKMGKLAKRRHLMHVIKNFGASIGFVAGDVPDQFASTEAGGMAPNKLPMFHAYN